tara:strand:- start:1390 stop:2322 length:933 start_codon:yes stop_codon:yes gene_type:complete
MRAKIVSLKNSKNILEESQLPQELIIDNFISSHSTPVIHSNNFLYRLPSAFTYIVTLLNSFSKQHENSRNINGIDPVNNRPLLIGGMSLAILQGLIMLYNNNNSTNNTNRIDGYSKKNFFKNLNNLIASEYIFSSGLNIVNSFKQDKDLNHFLIALSFQLLPTWEISILRDAKNQIELSSKEKKDTCKTYLYYTLYLTSQALLCVIVFATLESNSKQRLQFAYSIISILSLSLLGFKKASQKISRSKKPLFELTTKNNTTATPLKSESLIEEKEEKNSSPLSVFDVNDIEHQYYTHQKYKSLPFFQKAKR